MWQWLKAFFAVAFAFLHPFSNVETTSVVKQTSPVVTPLDNTETVDSHKVIYRSDPVSRFEPLILKEAKEVEEEKIMINQAKEMTATEPSVYAEQQKLNDVDAFTVADNVGNVENEQVAKIVADPLEPERELQGEGRPPTSGPPPIIPTNGDGDNPGAAGDPHFITWKGHSNFDFHGACDLMLLQSSVADVRVHIRTKHRRNFSYISSAAVQVGKNVLEVTGNKEKDYWLNGELKKTLPVKLSPGNHIEHHVHEMGSADHKTITQNFLWHIGNGQVIVVKTWKDFVSVKIEHSRAEYFGDAVGLMGTYDGGKWMSRDGKELIGDRNEFGQHWQVREDEPQLFNEAPVHKLDENGNIYCPLPSNAGAETSMIRRRLNEITVTKEMALAACAHASNAIDLDFCVYDVMATNDVDMAGAY